MNKLTVIWHILFGEPTDRYQAEPKEAGFGKFYHVVDTYMEATIDVRGSYGLQKHEAEAIAETMNKIVEPL